MLSIWKLWTSSSISGLSWTTKPKRPKISAISSIESMLGWRLPRRTGRPGVVTSWASAARRDVRAEPRRSVPRSASAASIATRTALATAPTCGRSSGGRAPMPRRTAVSRPFLPRTSSSSASSAATSALDAIDASASSRSVSRSRVRSARSTSVLPSWPWESGTLERRRRRGPGEGRGRLVAGRCQTLFASSAILPKVAASRMARSARILRSISTSAFFRPAMKAP